MFKYGISYYIMEEGVHKPQSGVDIRLLRPGQSWAEGKHLIETTPNSDTMRSESKMKPTVVSMRSGTT